MMKSNTGSTTANNTDEILLNKTPQHHHKRIGRVTHSPLTAPCAEGVIRRRGGRGVERNDTMVWGWYWWVRL